MIPEIIKRYVDTGKVRFVYRDFPLTSIHASAQKAAEAAVCAGKQDRYWEMNEKLFASQSEWTAEGADPIKLFGDYATQLGLDATAFNACLDSGEAATAVKGDMLAGEQLGVNATPYFFIDEIPIRGGLSIDGFSAIIDYVAAGGSNVEIVPVGNWRVLGSTQTAKAAAVAFVDYADSKSRQFALEVLPQLTTDLHRHRADDVRHPPLDVGQGHAQRPRRSRRRVRRPAEQGLGDVHQAL